MYVSEHTGSRVHRQSFNHSVERIFLLLFFPPPLLPFFLPFVSHAAEFPRSPIRTITVTPRTPRFVISSSPLPNYLSTVQTDLFDTNRGHNRRPSAVLLGSARIIRSFPRTLSSRRKIHASRLNNDPSIDPTIAILLPLHSSSLNDLLPTASRLPLPLFTTFPIFSPRSNLEPRTRFDRRQLLESNSSRLRVNEPPPPPPPSSS